MQSEELKGGFVSEAAAQELLDLTKRFRQQWATFAVMSRTHFDAFRDTGASLPETFLHEYQSLTERKLQLARSIQERTTSIPVDVWGPPSAEQTLQEFEEALSDLVCVCREVQKQTAEKLGRYLRVLQGIVALQCLDQKFIEEFDKVRQQALKSIAELNQHPHLVMSTEHEAIIADFDALLKITTDVLVYRNISSVGASGDLPGLSAHEFEALFETVSQRFGRRVALEAARSRLAPQQEPSGQAIDRSALPTDLHGVGEAATKEAVASLIQNLNSRPQTAGVVSKRLTNSAGPTAPEPLSPISREQLAAAAHQLKLKADRLWPDGEYPYDAPGRLTADQIRAVGFRNLAVVIDLAGSVIAARGGNLKLYRGELHQLLKLFAEAQNAVRVEQENHGHSASPINEQYQAFQWLKHICAEDVEAFRIERFMRFDDRAAPENNIDVARRIREFSEIWSRVRSKDKHFSELTRVVDRIRSETASANRDRSIRLWEVVDSQVRALVNLGIHTNDVGIRDLILPIADLLPENVIDEEGDVDESGIDPSPEFSEVLEHIQSYLADRIQKGQDVPDEPECQEVKAVRELLSGKTIAVVAGIRKPHAAARIENALHLSELRWLSASKKDRVSEFDSRLNDVAIVVLITKLIGHKHNDLRDMCKERGIPWVQTKKSSGYSVNQIASVIMEQASQQLLTHG